MWNKSSLIVKNVQIPKFFVSSCFINARTSCITIFLFSRRLHFDRHWKERLETRHKQNITVKLYLNIESRAVAAVHEEILSRQCDSSIVFLKDNRRGLEHAHHRDTVPLRTRVAMVSWVNAELCHLERALFPHSPILSYACEINVYSPLSRHQKTRKKPYSPTDVLSLFSLTQRATCIMKYMAVRKFSPFFFRLIGLRTSYVTVSDKLNRLRIKGSKRQPSVGF